MSSVKAQSMTCTPLAGVPGNATTPGLNALPAGFPVNKDGKIAWVGSKISDGDYVYHLTEAERVEIYKAVIAFKGRCHTCLVALLSSLTRTPLLPLPLGLPTTLAVPNLVLIAFGRRTWVRWIPRQC